MTGVTRAGFLAGLQAVSVTLTAQAYTTTAGDLGKILDVTTGATDAIITLGSATSFGKDQFVIIRKALTDTGIGVVRITDGTSIRAIDFNAGFWACIRTNATGWELFDQYPEYPVSYRAGTYIAPSELVSVSTLAIPNTTTAHMYAIRYRIYAPVTITSMKIDQAVAVAGTLCRLGFYTGGIIPDNAALLIDGGEVDYGVTLNNSTPVGVTGLSTAIPPGDYWGLVHANTNATKTTVRVITAYLLGMSPQGNVDWFVSGNGDRGWGKDVAYATLPANLPTGFVNDATASPALKLGI